MTSYVSHTTVDCADAYRLSEWWKQVLGYADIEGDPNLPGHEECMIRSAETGHQLLFIEVPDVKQVKNRVHLDLRPVDRHPRRRGCPPALDRGEPGVGPARDPRRRDRLGGAG